MYTLNTLIVVLVKLIYKLICIYIYVHTYEIFGTLVSFKEKDVSVETSHWGYEIQIIQIIIILV